MSSKHVPEVTAPSRKEQLLALSLKLQGNKHFTTCKSRFGLPLKDILEELFKRTLNPSQCTECWRDFSGSVAVMTNLLAQYERDGWVDAATVLRMALLQYDYRLPADIVTFEKSMPVTAVMLKPELSLFVAEWFIHEKWTNLNGVACGDDLRSFSDRTQELFKRFDKLPSLLHRCNNPYDWTVGNEVAEVYSEAMKQEWKFINERLQPLLQLPLMGGQGFREIGYAPAVDQIPFLFLVKGTQEGVLKYFERRENEVATWQLSIPQMDEFLFVGLHPETEHTYWQQCFPAFVSKGLSQNLGGIILPHQMFDAENTTVPGHTTKVSVYDCTRRNLTKDGKVHDSSHTVFGPITRDANAKLFRQQR